MDHTKYTYVPSRSGFSSLRALCMQSWIYRSPFRFVWELLFCVHIYSGSNPTAALRHRGHTTHQTQFHLSVSCVRTKSWPKNETLGTNQGHTGHVPRTSATKSRESRVTPFRPVILQRTSGYLPCSLVCISSVVQRHCLIISVTGTVKYDM